MSTAPAPGTFTPWHPAENRPLELAMQSITLGGEVLPVGARLVVRHVFRSAESAPVEVVYAFGLPRDAALRRFRVEGDGFSVHSELQPAAEAERRYEEALEEGHLASLARVHRDGVVNLAVGNLRPGETVAVVLELVAGVEPRDDGLRFRFPFTLPPAYHARATVETTGPGEGEILLPEDAFGNVLLPTWRDTADGLHRVDLDLLVRVPGNDWDLSSPSHRVRVAPAGEGLLRVRLAADGDLPNRDLVLDVRHARPRATLLAGTDPAGRGRFALHVPSTTFGAPREDAPRRLAVVLDRSGSMSGLPLDRAREAIAGILSTLRPEDEFALLAFDTSVERFPAEGLRRGDDEARAEAREFLAGIDARGGTEILPALLAAAELLEGGGDILLVTDGQVAGSEDVVAGIGERGVRVHALGIGSAARDRFLAALARRTGGASRAVGPREDVAAALRELFAGIGGAVARGLRVETERLPEAEILTPVPGTVLAGSPLVIAGRTAGPATGRVRFSWSGDDGEEQLALALEIPEDRDTGETLALLAAAREITDIEATLGPERGSAWEAARRRLEELGREAGLASRAMALVAVVEREGDRPGAPPLTRVVPVGMPEDEQFEGYFQAAAMRAFPAFDHADLAFHAACAPPPARHHRRVPARLARRLEELAASILSGSLGNERDAAAALVLLLLLLAAGRTRRDHRHLVRTLAEQLGYHLQRLEERALLLREALDLARGGDRAREVPDPDELERIIDELDRATRGHWREDPDFLYRLARQLFPRPW